MKPLDLWSKLGLALLEEKHIELHLADTGTSELSAEEYSGGGLHTPSSGNVIVVKANVGLNKVSIR